MNMRTGYMGLVLSLSAASMLSFTGCGGSGGTTVIGGDIDTGITPPAIEAPTYTLAGRVLDAKTGSPVADAEVKAYATDSEKIIFTGKTDPLGNIFITATSKNSNINIVVNKDKYVDTGRQVLTTDEAVQNFTIAMINIDNEPTGVNTEVETIPAANVPLGITIDSSVTSNGKTVTTEIDIPAGTTMTTENGDEVTGDLSIQLSNYSATEETSTNAFPGGFAIVANINGTDVDGAFETAGFVSIEIKDANGNKVKNFDQPIEVKMQIDDNFINPLTGAKIAIGDKIPVWSYDDITAAWAFEQDGTVQDLNTADGLVDVVVQADHLSYWNLDWHYSAVCQNIQVNLVDTAGARATGTYRMRANFVGSSGYLFQGTISGDGFAKLRNVPLNKPMVFGAYNLDGTLNSQKTVNVTSCDASTITMTVTPPVAKVQKMTLTESCSDGSKSAVLPYIYVYSFTNTMNYIKSAYTDANGAVSTDYGVNDNPRYFIYTRFFADRWKVSTSGSYYGYFQVDRSNTDDFTVNFELQDEYCPPVIPTGSEGGS